MSASIAEKIDEILRRTMLPRDDPEYLEPNAARVVIDAIKWQAGKENQGRYGDRIIVEDDQPKKILSREETLKQVAASGLSLGDVFGVLAKPTDAPLIEIEGAQSQSQSQQARKSQASVSQKSPQVASMPDVVDFDT